MLWGFRLWGFRRSIERVFAGTILKIHGGSLIAFDSLLHAFRTDGSCRHPRCHSKTARTGRTTRMAAPLSIEVARLRIAGGQPDCALNAVECNYVALSQAIWCARVAVAVYERCPFFFRIVVSSRTLSSRDPMRVSVASSFSLCSSSCCMTMSSLFVVDSLLDLLGGVTTAGCTTAACGATAAGVGASASVGVSAGVRASACACACACNSSLSSVFRLFAARSFREDAGSFSLAAGAASFCLTACAEPFSLAADTGSFSLTTGAVFETAGAETLEQAGCGMVGISSENS
mmetsp:Transcript_28908/g.47971  ORF Transcript_28908/g.47971 Transcript_28908/m.47971 type:complete len:289 (+) Transcript_28908:192-1058(+)